MIGGASVAEEGGSLFTHASFGRIVHEFSNRAYRVNLCVGKVNLRASSHDYLLPDNVSLTPIPLISTAFSGYLKSREVENVIRKAISQSDAIFVRGVLIPAVDAIYDECVVQNKPICHWLVGNPMALLQSHRRYGWLMDTVGKIFVKWWERELHRGHSRARAAYLCNGEEIAKRHPSPRCHITVSTSITKDSFFYREDTCIRDSVRILCLSYIRPEKGIEYLIEAFAQLSACRPKELVLVGSRDRYPAYQKKLDRLIEKYRVVNQVTWVDHVDYLGVLRQLREADIFAFPSLSEGTPRVLVEARANSLPIVSTNVGGIPTSVTHGYDGLLVPPKDPGALAKAIDRLIIDGELRRRLIDNGYKKAGNFTVDRFVDQVEEILNQL